MTQDYFKTLYARHSKMLYSIALNIADSTSTAEMILIKTFQKASAQNISPLDRPSLCAILIKLLFESAREVIPPDGSQKIIKLKQFENLPLLQKMLCEQLSLENHCQEENVTTDAARRSLREEVNMLRKKKEVIQV